MTFRAGTSAERAKPLACSGTTLLSSLVPLFQREVSSSSSSRTVVLYRNPADPRNPDFSELDRVWLSQAPYRPAQNVPRTFRRPFRRSAVHTTEQGSVGSFRRCPKHGLAEHRFG